MPICEVLSNLSLPQVEFHILNTQDDEVCGKAIDQWNKKEAEKVKAVEDAAEDAAKKAEKEEDLRSFRAQKQTLFATVP